MFLQTMQHRQDQLELAAVPQPNSCFLHAEKHVPQSALAREDDPRVRPYFDGHFAKSYSSTSLRASAVRDVC